jgi:hypothetical protein
MTKFVRNQIVMKEKKLAKMVSVLNVMIMKDPKEMDLSVRQMNAIQ